MDLRDPKVFGASMPEATVDKHGDLARPEHQVGPSTKVGERLIVYAVPKTSSVDRGSNRKLRSSVSTPIALHDPGGRGRCR